MVSWKPDTVVFSPVDWHSTCFGPVSFFSGLHWSDGDGGPSSKVRSAPRAKPQHQRDLPEYHWHLEEPKPQYQCHPEEPHLVTCGSWACEKMSLADLGRAFVQLDGRNPLTSLAHQLVNRLTTAFKTASSSIGCPTNQLKSWLIRHASLR